MRRGGYLKRKTRLKSRGGSLFPHKRQPKFMAWMLEKCSERRPCDGCGQWHWLERAHLKPRGSGGADLSNLALLCNPCHRTSEKRVDAWIAEHGVDLYAIAREHERAYRVSGGT